jgi:hypothetical protein
MTLLRNILISFLIFTSCNQQNNTSNSDTNTKIDTDTIIDETPKIDTALEDSIKVKLGISDSIRVLLYETEPCCHYFVFIDYNPQSDYYERIQKTFNLPERSPEYVQKQFNESSNRTSDSISNLINSGFDFLLGTWINLYSFENELYVINSCEYEGSYLLTDSLFYDGYYMDGPDISSIKSIQKLSEKRYQIQFETWLGKLITFDFYQYDQRGSFLVKISNKFDKDIYSLMTTIDNARNYRLVHHDCTDLMDRYSFDEVDFQAIISNFEE